MNNGFVDFTPLGIKPGVERWLVKTGMDHDADLVNGTPVETTVEALRNEVRPHDMPLKKAVRHYQNFRADPVELTTFTVEAKIIEYKLEHDGDYHIVISSEVDDRLTMIAEIPYPDPQFVDPRSPFADQILAARAAFEAMFPPPTDIGRMTPADGQIVTLTGVGFFDFLHNQTGVSRTNGIELHPVLGIQASALPG